MLSGCASVPDKPLCTDLRPGAGFCVWTISNKEMEVDDTHLLNGKTWYDMQIGIIKMPIETFVALKAYLITSCKRNKNCSDKIDSWDRALTTLENKATAVSEEVYNMIDEAE